MDFPRLQATSKVSEADWSYPQPAPLRTGKLPVDHDPDHALYWEEYGNHQGEPVMFLHGGPGGGCAPNMARFFDPKRYRIILFDQRGCGKSTPNVAADGAALALAKNTTDNLVSDILKLREALDIRGRMHVFGGSWGSTLALVYAIRHPETVASLVLRGIFLGRTEDLLYMYQGNADTWASDPYGLTAPGTYATYPEAWSLFVGLIPEDERGDMMGAYKRIFDGKTGDRALQLKAAQTWSVWEGTISNLIPEARDPGKFGESAFALCFAQIEAHYFANSLFLPEGYILNNVARLQGIPIHVVHGRFDQCTPLNQASALVEALAKAGNPAKTYVTTAAGHSAMERENALALTAIMDGLGSI